MNRAGPFLKSTEVVASSSRLGKVTHLWLPRATPYPSCVGKREGRWERKRGTNRKRMCVGKRSAEAELWRLAHPQVKGGSSWQPPQASGGLGLEPCLWRVMLRFEAKLREEGKGKEIGQEQLIVLYHYDKFIAQTEAKVQARFRAFLGTEMIWGKGRPHSESNSQQKGNKWNHFQMTSRVFYNRSST